MCVCVCVCVCYLIPITKNIKVRRNRHAEHCWRSRGEVIRNVLLWTPSHDRAKAGLSEDTGCTPDDLPEAMYDRVEW